ELHHVIVVPDSREFAVRDRDGSSVWIGSIESGDAGIGHNKIGSIGHERFSEKSLAKILPRRHDGPATCQTSAACTSLLAGRPRRPNLPEAACLWGLSARHPVCRADSPA